MPFSAIQSEREETRSDKRRIKNFERKNEQTVNGRNRGNNVKDLKRVEKDQDRKSQCPGKF